MSKIKLGIIGLDTSHVTAFTELLHNPHHKYHVPGGEVVVAFPGGSPDFALSSSRVEGFTSTLRNQYGVHICDDIKEVAEQVDAVLLESVDGRVHLEQFRAIVPFHKPVFIDKPFALNSTDAAEMIRLARQYETPVMSCSALRYSEALTSALNADTPTDAGSVVGCDTSGPMAIEPTQPGLFWYGIHSVEVLFAVLGKDCVSVSSFATDQHDVVVGVWADGRIGTVRGNRSGNYQFSAVIHRDKESQFINISGCEKPYYASLLEHVMELFKTGVSPLNIDETARIVRFIECANASRETGQAVKL